MPLPNAIIRINSLEERIDSERLSLEEKLDAFGGGVYGDLSVSGDLTVGGVLNASVSGDAEEATKASQDARGNIIDEAYTTKDVLTSSVGALSGALSAHSKTATATEEALVNSIKAKTKKYENTINSMRGVIFTEVVDDSEAYLKETGNETLTGGAEVMPYAKLKSLSGKTTLWDYQLVRNGNFVDKSHWVGQSSNFKVSNNICSFTTWKTGGSVSQYEVVRNSCAGDKIYFGATIKTASVVQGLIGGYLAGGEIVAEPTTEWQTLRTVATIGASGKNYTLYIYDKRTEGWDEIQVKNVMCYNLTQMFGEGNEPSVEEFEALFSDDAYPSVATPLIDVGVRRVKSLGKARVWNQLVPEIIKPSATQAGTTEASSRQFVVTITTTGASSSTGPYFFPSFLDGSGISNHKVYARVKVKSDVDCRIRCGTDYAPTFPVYAGDDFVTLRGLSVPYNSASSWFIQHDAGCEGKTVTFKDAQLFDLTVMFGEGNEPSVEEFEALFTDDYYSNDDGGTENVIDSFVIPDEVQSLEGYGWSSPTAKNWIDFEGKVYHREVGRRDYVAGDEGDSTVLTDGTTTYYPLGETEDVDVSHILTGDGLIRVEDGGVLVFENQLNSDTFVVSDYFCVPVHSEVSYVCKL